MKINSKFFQTIKPTLNELTKKIGNDFVIFGSAPLYLLGVVDFDKSINDLDVAVKNKKNIPKEAEKVTFQKNPNQIFYKLKINGTEVDIGICWKNQKDLFNELFKNPIEVSGYKFVNLEMVEKWKMKMVKDYNREKDKNYLRKIKEYRLKQKDE